MLLIQNKNTNPYYNLALEEYLLKEFRKEEHLDCFMLWQNEPCVVVGKNQNVLAEINEEFVTKNNIKLARRLSGGGAVYHDLGNLNFTFIINDNENSLRDYKKFLAPIIETLASIGVKAKMSDRNDLTINGLKFSGNAQYKHKNRLLHHGTILFSSNLNNVRAALKTDNTNRGRWVNSVPSPITNIQEHLPNNLNLEDYIILIQEQINAQTFYKLMPADNEMVKKLAIEKYSTPEWIYAKSFSTQTVERSTSRS